MSEDKKTGLELLRVPFEPHHISKLPQQQKWMTEKKEEYKSCNICGGWHHPKAIHLDYVGHAALTDRLLDADPKWNWEPVAFGPDGNPLMVNGGLWIRLTVDGVTRLGYGDAQQKQGHNAIKEAIGDALRNAAMRFGAALDLWHKGDLHEAKEAQGSKDHKPGKKTARTKTAVAASIKKMVFAMTETSTIEGFQAFQQRKNVIDLMAELESEWPEEHANVTEEFKKQYERLKNSDDPTVDIEQLYDDCMTELKRETNGRECLNLRDKHQRQLLSAGADPKLIQRYEYDYERYIADVILNKE